MYNRKANVTLRVNEHMQDYVEFLRDYHDGYEELVEQALTQPFKASLETYHRYERDGLQEGVRIMPLYLSMSETVREAIDLYSEGNESDQHVLQRIIYDHFNVEPPKPN